MKKVLTVLTMMFALALLGLVFARLGYSRPSFFLGYVLGNLAERYFGIALLAYGWTFFLRPISLFIIVLIILGVSLQPMLAVE